MPGDTAFSGRLKKGMLNRQLSYTWSSRLPAVPPETDFQNDNHRLSLWTRMFYSCLVDADYLDTEKFMSGGMVERGGYDPLSELWSG
ncbi:MAG: hypothetical protein ACI4MF_02155 [Candidatus Faecivicinus sp.]